MHAFKRASHREALLLSSQFRALRKRADLTGWVVLYIIGRIYIKRRIQGDMDTDSGDHPGNLPGCHLFFAAYLRRLTRGRRAFLRL